MTLAEVSDNDVFTGREVKALLRDILSPPAILTTVQAARWYGYSPKSWLKWAPTIDGSFREDRLWRLPRDGCEAKIAALKVQADKRRGLRGPRRRVPTNPPEPRYGRLQVV